MMPSFAAYSDNYGYYGEGLGETLTFSESGPTHNGHLRCRVDIDGRAVIVSIVALKRIVDAIWAYNNVPPLQTERKS